MKTSNAYCYYSCYGYPFGPYLTFASSLHGIHNASRSILWDERDEMDQPTTHIHAKTKDRHLQNPLKTRQHIYKVDGW